eukprot:CAMPEP_0113828816 /NCGR_PEP_ID=MMETSP0328-20130328/5477_1 /TAXON_ID=39455 /ORGANISM="Alexandrium minutum" /LENGTH=99 /DNA_ID=CAMNT_0000796847 /DNA_START=8 /DNA_END=307 /DNA_ORIENTATION=- /assembly_acc=CAM_ASM_000350
MVCECQWGLTGVLLGAVIVVAAGAFAFFPVCLGLLKFDWYIFLCWAWFFLGAALFSCGCLWEIMGCQPKGRWAAAREAEDGDFENGMACPPAPYIMITA